MGLLASWGAQKRVPFGAGGPILRADLEGLRPQILYMLSMVIFDQNMDYKITKRAKMAIFDVFDPKMLIFGPLWASFW